MLSVTNCQKVDFIFVVTLAVYSSALGCLLKED